MPEKVQKSGLVAKQVDDNTFKFILSDESIDRDGDIIMADGWQLSEFKKNPVALAYHDHNKPIGRWKNLKIEDKALTGELELAPDDVGPMQRAINKLIRDGFLKAVSVGFRGLEVEPLESTGGYRFLKQALFETSVVAVPSNPQALAVAKSCNISDNEMSKIFVDGRPSTDDETPPGDSAADNPIKRAKAAVLAVNRLMRQRT